MRYDFECASCSFLQEVSYPMAEKPDVLPCPQCGGEARQVFTTAPESFVRGRPFVYDKAKNCMSNGRMFGRTDQQQHEGYRQYFDGLAKANRQRRASGSKKGEVQWLGGAPAEMCLSFGDNVGQRDAAYKDPVGFLKANDLYQGEK